MKHKFFDPAPGDEDFIDRPATPRARAMLFTDLRCRDIWRGGQIIAVNDSTTRVTFDTREPMYWPNTAIRIPQLIVVLQTDEYDPIDSQDAGLRKLYVPKARQFTESWHPFRHTLYDALFEAMKAAGHPYELPQTNGHLFVKWMGEEPMPRGTRKLYIMRYTPPGDECIAEF